MQLPRPLILSLLALATLPALSACGSDDAGAPAASAAGDTVRYERPAGTKDADARAGTGTAVELANSQFAPAAITVKVGDEITWKNADSFPHTVTATANATFDSGTLEAGGTFKYVAKRAGTISYLCELHPGMTGTIVVE